MSAELVPVPQAGAVAAVWSEEQVEILRDQMCAEASDAELGFFAQVASHQGLDPFAGEIIAQMRYDKRAGKKVLVIQPTVAGLRTIAERTGLYGGQSAPEWCGPDGVWKDVWLDTAPPAAARVQVYRKDWVEPQTGIATYASYVQLNNDGRPQAQWASGADYMLWKCAEAAALKRAFRRQLEDAGVNTREYTPPERASMEARLAGLDEDARHALVAEITGGRTDSTREVTDDELLELRAEVARLRAQTQQPHRNLRSVTSVGPGGSETHWYDTETGERVDPPAAAAVPGPGHDPEVCGGTPQGHPGPGTTATAGDAPAVDTPGSDPADVAPGVEGPTPPASTTTTPAGPTPDNPHWPATPRPAPAPAARSAGERADVTQLKWRLNKLTPEERSDMRRWLAAGGYPDTTAVTEDQVAAINAELDRRAAAEEVEPF